MGGADSPCGGQRALNTNNHFRGKAVTNALQLIHLLKRTRVKVPPPLLQLYPEELEPIASREGTTPSLFRPA